MANETLDEMQSLCLIIQHWGYIFDSKLSIQCWTIRAQDSKLTCWRWIRSCTNIHCFKLVLVTICERNVSLCWTLLNFIICHVSPSFFEMTDSQIIIFNSLSYSYLTWRQAWDFKTSSRHREFKTKLNFASTDHSRPFFFSLCDDKYIILNKESSFKIAAACFHTFIFSIFFLK